MKKSTKLILLAGAALSAAALDIRLKKVKYTIRSNKLTKPVKLVFLSDLHSACYGENYKELLAPISEEKPDFVLMGGDMVEDHGEYEHVFSLTDSLAGSYPTFFVSGNHEVRCFKYKKIRQRFISSGIRVLENETEYITAAGQKIAVSGEGDPYFSEYEPYLTDIRELSEKVPPDVFSILLSHRPELAEEYFSMCYDLSFAGHAHGGQWRVPGLINGVFAPNQGPFPRYAGGEYKKGSKTLIVGRGLENRFLPVPRLFNRPELVTVDICPNKPQLICTK